MDKLLGFLTFGVICLVACEPINRYLSLPDDNFAEELSEAAIKIETGLDVDLTPSSPE